MKNWIILAFVSCSLYCSGQNWQVLHDSASYYLDIGNVTKAHELANRLPSGKDAKQQYQKHLLHSLIQFGYSNLRSSIYYLDQAKALVNNRAVKLSHDDFIDLQFDYCDRYYEMNEMEKVDSLLEVIKKQSGKTIPEAYYTLKINTSATSKKSSRPIPVLTWLKK